MDKFVITGGKPLGGTVAIAGAKNVALKVFIAALLTDEKLTIHNVPDIVDVVNLLEVLRHLGVQSSFQDHTVTLQSTGNIHAEVPLDVGARFRTAILAFGPLLARFGTAKIPNPGGCRLGARPIDRHIDALRQMGAAITYNSDDGYFYGTATHLVGVEMSFAKNTHTGTETVLLAAVLARGKTIIHNAAEEVEIDDLISLLNLMGAQIVRSDTRTIEVTGVDALHGAQFSIMPDRNEEVTFAVAAAITGGDITVTHSQRAYLAAFLEPFVTAGGGVEALSSDTTRYFLQSPLVAQDVYTAPHPGFMTDWQGPWAVLMTRATGTSTIHERVFESRFSYVSQLRKMGADIEFFNPPDKHQESFYNFNWSDRVEGHFQAIRIQGPTQFHNAVLQMDDLRAGATLVLAALTAEGESYIHGIHHIDRGYEHIEERLRALGAYIQRVKEES